MSANAFLISLSTGRFACVCGWFMIAFSRSSGVLGRAWLVPTTAPGAGGASPSGVRALVATGGSSGLLGRLLELDFLRLGFGQLIQRNGEDAVFHLCVYVVHVDTVRERERT